jgi:hypothetical protein
VSIKLLDSEIVFGRYHNGKEPDWKLITQLSVW